LINPKGTPTETGVGSGVLQEVKNKIREKDGYEDN
jgi:hypothetical protein